MTRPTCRQVRPSDEYHGKQGFDYFEGIAGEPVDAHALCMHFVFRPEAPNYSAGSGLRNAQDAIIADV